MADITGGQFVLAIKDEPVDLELRKTGYVV